MSAPNVEGTINSTSTGGSTFGVQVGSKATETVGFFGSTGTTQATASSMSGNVTLLITYLQSLGLLG